MDSVPFDFEATQLIPDWRDKLRWPLMIGEMREIGDQLAKAIMALGYELKDDDTGRAILLAGPVMISQTLILLEATWSLARTEAEGIRLESQQKEIAFLRGEEIAPPESRFRRIPQRKKAPERLLRSIARTSSWSDPVRLAQAFIRPEAFAVNHNPLLRQQVRNSRRAVLFQDGDNILLSAREKISSNPNVPSDLVEKVVELMCGLVPLQGFLAERLRNALTAKVQFHLQEAYIDLAATRKMQLPALEFWSGTAGNRVSRVIGLAMAERNGRVVVFDHGGSTGMLASGAPIGLLEGVVADRFCAYTPKHADMCREGPLGQEIAKYRQMDFVGGDGDPQIQALNFQPIKSPPVRPRVMLVTGAYLGHRQINPPLPRDPVYLDWHMRLVDLLKTLPIDLAIKPHPEGYFRGRRHPLSDFGPVVNMPFETAIDEADLLIFDFPLSTTFWTAMCSWLPIVYLDLGVAPLNNKITNMISERCAMRPVPWGSRGLPELTRDTLWGAIDQALHGEVNAEPFRQLYLKTDF